MKINSINSPSFQKTLIAKAEIGNKDNPQSVNIYHMDELSDYFQLCKKIENNNWRNNRYADNIFCEFKSFFNKRRYLVMENDNGDIVCYATIEKHYPPRKRGIPYTEIHYLETAPKFSKEGCNDRRYRYAGETMMACIVNMTKIPKQKSYIELTYRNASGVIDFYKQNKFDIVSSSKAILPSSKFDEMLKTNAGHIRGSLNMCV